MAGFFYLGGRDESSRKQVEREEQQQGLFLYKNEEIYSNNNNNNNNNKGFEIWPEYYLQHHHHQQAVNGEYSTFGAGPSRRNLSFSDELTSRSAGFTVMRSQGLGGIGGGGGINCQDCGNQAKKDCVHLRCRTCCKSRGFECPTHIKSTWVPAAKRRERQQQLEALQRQQQQQEEQKQQTQLRVENTKRHRDDDEDGGGGHDQQGLDMVQFPSEVNSPALFRCVKVSGIDDAEEAYAYQTAVNIGGHVFKGILYDQGPNGGEESSPGGVGHSTQQLDLIMAAETNNNSGAVAVNTTSSNDEAAVLDPSLYPAPLNAFMTGTQFFPCSRP